MDLRPVETRSREDLHNLFLTICPTVYFQEPNNLVMQSLGYPCILYSPETAEATFADNQKYLYRQRYQVTVIDEDPDSDLPLKVAALPWTKHDRWFAVDNLNHQVFTMYF